MRQFNVMWVQISIYFLVLFLRLAAFALYGLIFTTTVSFEPDMIRVGVDLAFMGIGIFLGASTITGFSALNFKGQPFITWLAILSGLFIATYFMFIVFRDNSLAEIRKDYILTSLYCISLIFGGTCLLLGGLLTGTVKKKGAKNE